MERVKPRMSYNVRTFRRKTERRRRADTVNVRIPRNVGHVPIDRRNRRTNFNSRIIESGTLERSTEKSYRQHPLMKKLN